MDFYYRGELIAGGSGNFTPTTIIYDVVQWQEL
jgi:hypothetical protein